MSSLIATLSAQGLAPIALDDATFWAVETYVTPAAAQAISEGEARELDCHRLTDAMNGIERICRRVRTHMASRRPTRMCMTREEWRAFNQGS